MSLLVTGSIGIDTVTTPFGTSENCIGGSAVYFSMAASFFGPVRFTGVVGEDCPFDLNEVFAGRDVDLRGLESRQFSKTFRWKGSYHDTMNEAITDQVELNVLAEAPPKVPEEFTSSEFLFLANTAPSLQIQLLDKLTKPTFVAADTMNFYIQGYNSDLRKLLRRVDCLIINEDEARMLADDRNLIRSGQAILEMGPRVVVLKKGESGSMMFERTGEKFLLPAYPAVNVVDPTGAGDSFAGGFMGYLSQQNQVNIENLKKAMAYGTVVSSFTISDFSLKGLSSASRGDIETRFGELKKLTSF